MSAGGGPRPQHLGELAVTGPERKSGGATNEHRCRRPAKRVSRCLDVTSATEVEKYLLKGWSGRRGAGSHAEVGRKPVGRAPTRGLPHRERWRRGPRANNLRDFRTPLPEPKPGRALRAQKEAERGGVLGLRHQVIGGHRRPCLTSVLQSETYDVQEGVWLIHGQPSRCAPSRAHER